MKKQHNYKTGLQWTGNTGRGTSDYRAYERSYTLSIPGKPDIPGSSDPAFRGDQSRYNPEELLVASLSSCHMLWYLHLCAQAGVVVVHYTDNAVGIMAETATGGGHFTGVVLNPVVTVQDETMCEKALSLHKKAHEFCFIANSVAFEVQHVPSCLVEGL